MIYYIKSLELKFYHYFIYPQSYPQKINYCNVIFSVIF